MYLPNVAQEECRSKLSKLYRGCRHSIVVNLKLGVAVRLIRPVLSRLMAMFLLIAASLDAEDGLLFGRRFKIKDIGPPVVCIYF